MRRWLGLAAGSVALLVGCGGDPVEQAAGPRWVTAWQAPAHGVFPRGLRNQTLRTLVTPHAKGDRARIVLSNQFGGRTVRISGATIARRGRGAAVAENTLRTVRFKGRRSFSIAPGRRIVTDPTSIRVAPFGDVAVSVAFKGPTGPPTYHYNGLQTSYVSAPGSGDRSRSGSGAAFTTTTPMRFFVTGLEVRARSEARTVVAIGDSITDGGVDKPDTYDRNARWPDFLQRRLGAQSRLSVANAGLSANQILRDGPAALPVGGPSLLRRFGRDVLAQPNVAAIVLAEGINDIGLSRASAPEVIGGMTRVAQRAHAADKPIAIATLTPIKGASYDSPAAQATLRTVNAWILRQKVFDAVIDFDAAVQDPGDPMRLRPAYDSGDHLHPNARGFQAMAKAVPLRNAFRSVRGHPRFTWAEM